LVLDAVGFGFDGGWCASETEVGRKDLPDALDADADLLAGCLESAALDDAQAEYLEVSLVYRSLAPFGMRFQPDAVPAERTEDVVERIGGNLGVPDQLPIGVIE
jgi:hypothetical protein